MPRRFAVPAFNSSTARIGCSDGIGVLRVGHCVRRYLDDDAHLVDEQHVERQGRVLHPKRDRLRRLKVEQHPMVGLHGPPKHQAPLALPGGARELDGEAVRSGGGIDHQLARIEG